MSKVEWEWPDTEIANAKKHVFGVSQTHVFYNHRKEKIE